MTLPQPPDEAAIPELMTVSGIGREFGLPMSTADRRLKRSGIKPDGVLLRGNESPALLFSITRMPELEAALTKGGSL